MLQIVKYILSYSDFNRPLHELLITVILNYFNDKNEFYLKPKKKPIKNMKHIQVDRKMKIHII